MPEFGDYIIYVDESGDHSLTTIDTSYPVFVLAFCIVPKDHYADSLSPQIKKLKFELFGHDNIIFHEREIRKAEDEFSILLNPRTRKLFNDRIAHIVENSSATIIAAAINKTGLTQRYTQPDNPYNLGLGFCMERAAMFLESKGQAGKLTHIVVESRGKNEDRDLELSFRQVIDGVKVGTGLSYNVGKCKFDIQFTTKAANMAGLQFADLIARPIGRHVIDKEQPNRAMDIIKTKLLTNGKGGIEDSGLKVFPNYPKKS
ncbi:MAG: DUF3800 domain-containing protein [Alphaproteobacteria bacterium PRO2]|nr:DUF3800 domain-containing protein [Alphaproteobacteria bacterium PRO2]